MARSVKKGPYVAHHLKAKIDKLNESGKHEVITTWSRSSMITPEAVGHTFGVHTGRDHKPVFVTEDMVGHKFGEFAPTRTFKGHAKKKK